ncbi:MULTISPECIES: hypothetical protein [Aquimarina]|uniref:hypothetical protein n=1 Tax=Aquimarina TaxID=290174 RepID=UPI001358F9B9|nr:MULTISPECIES: hypothetical protein [Aquimarina]
MRYLLMICVVGLFAVSCSDETLKENENLRQIEKDEYEIPPNGIEKDEYEIPDNG